MELHVDENELLRQEDGSSIAGILLNADNGCENGFCMGISYRKNAEYDEPDVHDDQEGFYVLAGSGMAHVGEEEFALHPGVSFIVPRGVSHSIKKDFGSEPLKMVYAHGSV